MYLRILMSAAIASIIAAPGVSNYKILMISSPLGSKSHNIFMIAIAKSLTGRGHQVTIRCDESFIMEPHNGIKYETTRKLFSRHKMVYQLRPSHFTTFVEDLEETINFVYTDPRITKLLLEPIDPVTNTTKYDLVVYDDFVHGIYLPLAHYLGVPSVLAVAFMQPQATLWNLNIPHPFSYANYIGYQEPMSLIDRTKSFLRTLFYVGFANYVFYPKLDLEIRKFVPNAPNVRQLASNVSFVLMNSHPSLQDRLPTMPYVAEIGCIHCTPAKPLPKDLENIIQSSGEAGVIYFSMGSYVGLEWMPVEFGRKLMKVLGQLPQTILWRGGLNVSILPNNFRPVKWIPQQDVLAHPKVRLMINNGGLLSCQEAAYHACPILGFPIFGDHPYAMEHAKRLGYGEYLDWSTFTTETLRQTVKTMIHDKKYREAAVRVSALARDRPLPPDQLAAYWIEYVVRNKGAHFLKSGAEQLRWYQYFSIDVLILIAATSAVLTVVMWKSFRYCFAHIRNGLCKQTMLNKHKKQE